MQWATVIKFGLAFPLIVSHDAHHIRHGARTTLHTGDMRRGAWGLLCSAVRLAAVRDPNH